MPNLSNLTAKFTHLETGTASILLEWDIESHFRDPTIKDAFEIQVSVWKGKKIDEKKGK